MYAIKIFPCTGSERLLPAGVNKRSPCLQNRSKCQTKICLTQRQNIHFKYFRIRKIQADLDLVLI